MFTDNLYLLVQGLARDIFDSFIAIPHICHFFKQAKFLENKIYPEKTRKLRQNTQKIANFLRYYGKIHSKLPIFRVKSVKIYTGQIWARDKYEVWFDLTFIVQHICSYLVKPALI